MVFQKQDILYHYCGGEAFFNIIKTSTLWLSDILKSNDSQECIWFRNMVKEKIETHLAQTDDALKIWNKGYKLTEDLEDIATLYVACFSESKDSLSQWRGYAQDGSGIAIGFSKSHLQAVNGLAPYNLKFTQVNYQNKEKFINRIVNENLKNMTTKGIFHVALEFNMNYCLEFAQHKHPSFEEEKEWRMILKSRVGAPKIRQDFKGIEFSETKFRFVNGKIISYIEMDFSKIKQEIIKEIWIGPKSKITPTDIKNMLSVYGYYGETPYNENEPIPIVRSRSPYR